MMPAAAAMAPAAAVYMPSFLETSSEVTPTSHSDPSSRSSVSTEGGSARGARSPTAWLYRNRPRGHPTSPVLGRSRGYAHGHSSPSPPLTETTRRHTLPAETNGHHPAHSDSAAHTQPTTSGRHVSVFALSSENNNLLSGAPAFWRRSPPATAYTAGRGRIAGCGCPNANRDGAARVVRVPGDNDCGCGGAVRDANVNNANVNANANMNANAAATSARARSGGVRFRTMTSDFGAGGVLIGPHSSNLMASDLNRPILVVDGDSATDSATDFVAITDPDADTSFSGAAADTSTGPGAGAYRDTVDSVLVTPPPAAPVTDRGGQPRLDWRGRPLLPPSAETTRAGTGAGREARSDRDGSGRHRHRGSTSDYSVRPGFLTHAAVAGDPAPLPYCPCPSGTGARNEIGLTRDGRCRCVGWEPSYTLKVTPTLPPPKPLSTNPRVAPIRRDASSSNESARRRSRSTEGDSANARSPRRSRPSVRAIKEESPLERPGEKLIFNEEFSSPQLDMSIWEHEITAGGGGNYEFQYYTNNRTNSYIRDGVLYIKPTLTGDTIGMDKMDPSSGYIMDLGGNTPATECTGASFYGCVRVSGAGGNIVNPVQSARLRTAKAFSMKYGRLEVRAQMPKGDWLWPAIWLMPRWEQYGSWPASGEIDVVESKGNAPSYPGTLP